MPFDHKVPLDRLSKPCVAIVGFTDHRLQALDLPQDRFELWGLNELHRYHLKDLDRFDRWFEVHPRETLDPDQEHIKTIGGMTMPVYMHRHFEDIPPSVPFPREILQQQLGSEYFTSSIAWEIGLAILMGAEEIHVYGVDMANDTEYAEQRNCCEFWLGVAKGMGIKTYIPPTSDLLKAIGQYGFGETASLFAQKLAERIKWLHSQDNDRLSNIRQLDAQYEEKKAALENEYNQKREPLMTERNQIVGAIQDCNYWQRSWAIKNSVQIGGPSPDRSLDPRVGLMPVVPADDHQEAADPVNRIAALEAAKE